MRPLWAPFPPFYKMVPFTIIPQGLNKAIQWFRQECFINCRAWDDIITVLLGRAATLLLGFVLSWTWGEGRSFWCFFHFLLGGGWSLAGFSWIATSSGLQQFIHSTHVILGLPICQVFCMLGIHWWMLHTTSMDYFHCAVGLRGPSSPCHAAGTWHHSLQKMRQLQPRKVE